MKHKVLSIIMPVYNEARTFEEIFQKVLKQKVPLKKEILIVESGSTDGTRELVMKYATGKAKRKKLPDGTTYQAHSPKKVGNIKVTVFLESKARGKGHALQVGFKEVKGDIILIQDGDLEYKTSEYPKLLKPILSGKTDFVLGSRHAHGSTWKIRKMRGISLYAEIINLGHLFFTTLLNVLYDVSLTDPATMFKVFTSKSAENIHWKSNYFELDWEIVTKLIRKGYRPLEVPVYYASRTNEEGKKIRFFRDGFLVLGAIIRFRFSKI
ncbi:glycosyltransferase family 2 protein [Candidatus Woesearchaeota archaeon]|nr:glycosyltransferase family 2 protein [Candidatus Woesearchaeota archaeon]